MSWNYRIIKSTFKMPSGDIEERYAIHEVYYDNNGNIIGWSKDPVYISGESLSDLEGDLKLYREAFCRSVLDIAKLGERD